MPIKMDIDIDLADRSKLLSLLDHISASRKNNNDFEKHNTGVYFQNIPYDPETNMASIDYKAAEEIGYMKFDFLNNSIYNKVKNLEHLDELVKREPFWQLLEIEEFVENLAHLHGHYYLLKKFKPQNIDELAAFIALIRPGKKHLQNRSKKEIMTKIWDKNDPEIPEGEYIFKKSHSYAYALSIIVQMNIITEELEKEVL